MPPQKFRPGEDLAPGEQPAAPPPAPPPETFRFSDAADAGGTDLDILNGYQIFLGRDPENSFVIADAKSSPVGSFIRALLGSGEFQSSVLDRLESGRPLPHETAASAPAPRLIDWLFRFISVPDFAETMLRSAPGWRQFFRVFLAIPGAPTPQRRRADTAEAEAGPDVASADDNFVLITLEQPRPGETLHAGALVTGSGWCIAPADIAEVAVLLDGRVLTYARTGLPRPDVARNFAHYRHVDHCGFSFAAEIPADAALGADATLAIRVRTVRGEEGVKTLRIHPPAFSATAEEPALATEAWPIRLQIEEAAADGTGMLRARGWALAKAGVARITAALGDVALPPVTLGVPRPDIGRRHAEYPDAETCGFALVATLPDGAVAAPAFLRFSVEDKAGRRRAAGIPVLPPGTAAAEGLRLQLDQPVLEGDAARGVMRGALTISGWAVARSGVETVSILAGGTLLGRAHLGMRREDIGAAFPDYAGSLLSGFALILPPGSLAAGRHEITVRVAAKREGASRQAVTEQRFWLDAAPSHALPPQAELRRTLSPAEAGLGLATLARAGVQPFFEILMVSPDGERSEAALNDTLRDLVAQIWPHWQATVFAAGARQKARPNLPEIADAAGRIRLAPTPSAGVPAARARRKAAPAAGSNVARGAAAQAGAGQEKTFYLRLRAGDRLGADALLALAAVAARHADADFLYADEQRLDPSQSRMDGYFKPDWSPELLLSTNYIGRAWCCAVALAARAGMDPAGLAAAGDYDAVLRLTEQASAIHHIPRVLAQCAGPADTDALERDALAAAAARRGLRAAPGPTIAPRVWRFRRATNIETRAADPLVSVIMPSCSARGLVRKAIETLRATTAPALRTGIRIEIIVLDNTPAAQTKDRAFLRRHADRVIDMPGAFNWSAFNNAGAAAARGEFLLFLNDDVEAHSPGWLEALLEQAARPEVGVAGARLLYPDGTVQHAGQYLAEGHARHAFRFAAAEAPGPFGLAAATREVIAVTGACQMMRRAVFDALGGFDPAHSIVNNDLDFCLRCREHGLSVIYTPHATLTHHELASRATLADTFDEARFAARWHRIFALGDPYRNPNLAADSDQFSAEPEPVEQLVAGQRMRALADIRRVLVIKLDHIGDFLTALPALAALRARLPQARIDLLVPAASASLAAPGGTPAAHVPVDEVMIFDFFHARSGEGKRGVGEGEFESLQARLCARSYDLAIDLRMHPDTREILLHTGARVLAGYDQQNRFPWLDIALEWEGDGALVRKRAHISERLRALIGAIADAAAPAAAGTAAALPPISVPALGALPEAFLQRKLVCIHPGVGNPVRQWPPRHFASLIDMLAEEAGFSAVLVGAAEEAAIAEEVMRHVTHRNGVESLVGSVKLAQLPDIIRACALFVGNNSGPQHMAASLGIPCVGVHSGVVDAVEWAPLGARALAVRRRMVCGPCYLEFPADCPRGLACLTGLSPRAVFAACMEVMADGAPHG